MIKMESKNKTTEKKTLGNEASKSPSKKETTTKPTSKKPVVNDSPIITSWRRTGRSSNKHATNLLLEELIKKSGL